MIKATKIRMKTGKEHSNSVQEIDSIFLKGVKEERYYSKEVLHDYVKNEQNTAIHVDISPYPKLIAATNGNQKYVRSAPNDTPEDNLLKLPKE